MWDTMIHKIRKRLRRRKGTHLLFSSRVSLIRFFITTIPLLFLSLYNAPKLVLKELENTKTMFVGIEI